VSLLLPTVKNVSQLTKTHHFDDNIVLFCWTVQISALLASATAAAAAGGSEQ
jgi:hypothetical protein